MNAHEPLTEQSRDAVIEALLQIEDEHLIAEIGGRAGALEFNPQLAGADAMAPAPGFNPEGIGDDILAVGKRIFARANQDLCCVVCSDGAQNADSAPERKAILDAVEMGEGVLATVISGVLVGSFGLAPVIATVAATLIVKRVFRSSGAELCGSWASASGVTIYSANAVDPRKAAPVQSPPTPGLRLVQTPPQSAPEPVSDTSPVFPADGQRINMDQLFGLVQDPDIPRSQVQKYFRLDAARSDAFNPQVVVNQELVLPSRLESNTVLSIFNGYEMGRRQEAYAKRANKNLRLVSEGDSWFQYPFLLNDVIDQLFSRYPIYSLGAAGDVLSNMVRSTRLDEIIAQNQAHGLLFSGGGNDLLGEGRLAENVRRHHKPGMSAQDFINPSFIKTTENIAKNYRILFDRLTAKFPELRIFCHGYDYAIPQPGGKWLGAPMNEKGIEDPQTQYEIIRIMVDYHNATLAQLAASYGGRVVYVDCRGVAGGPDGWYDELHPTDEGFNRAAARFQAQIDATFWPAG